MNPGVDNLVTLLASLVSLSPRSMRALAKECDWNHTNMSLGLSNTRPFPKNRIVPLLSALDLTPGAKPYPHSPWRAVWKLDDDAESIRVALAHFFPRGGGAQQMTVSGSRQSDHLMAKNCCFIMADESAETFVVLSAPLPFGQGQDRTAKLSSLLSGLGMRLFPPLSTDEKTYEGIISGTISWPSPMQSPKSEGSSDHRWDDVIVMASTHGLSASDVARILSEHLNSEEPSESDILRR